MAIIDKPSDFINTKLYSGNASNDHAITGVGFQSDFTWLKARSGSQSTQPNWVFDSIRGATKPLVTNSSAAEETEAGSLKSWQSDGFTLGVNNEVNGSSTEYVSWNWKAGTSVSGNSGGSGTAKAYSGSVNTTSGFSIIKYIGNGSAGHTIPHHLSAIPKMMIIKTLGDNQWQVYHEAMGNTKKMCLDDTSAQSVQSNRWNDTTPTTSVFTLGNHVSVNSNDVVYIAYLFAEKQGYSKFGSYTGSGNADGPFTYTGMKPAFILLKRTDVAKNWYINDNKRLGYNPSNPYLSPNLSAAATGGAEINILSNGFKITASGSGHNASGGTYLYMALAENPFVTSTGNGSIPTTAR